MSDTDPNIVLMELECIDREAMRRAELDAITKQRDAAIKLLAQWCFAIDRNGTGWDDWDEHYKDAAYRPGPLRELIDAAIAKEKQEYESRLY